MLNILFVTNMYPHDGQPGSGAFVRQQAEYLQKLGHRVDVLRIAGDKSRLRYLTSAATVFAQTRKTPYDVVHAHYGLSAFPALFRHHSPLVVTLHGSDALVGRIQPAISRVVCSLADAVIVVSKSIAARIPGEVIPCGTDLELFKPMGRAAARARLGLPSRTRFVLFPFDPARTIKRYELARASVEALGDRDVQLLTVSGVRNEEMPFYYSAADVMILCSRSEGSPTSVKEALACNLPVVSTDVGDVREITNGIDGCHICEPSAQSLAEGLRRVFARNNPFDGRRSMERYDQRRTVTSIVEVYERVIRNRMAARRPAVRDAYTE